MQLLGNNACIFSDVKFPKILFSMEISGKITDFKLCLGTLFEIAKFFVLLKLDCHEFRSIYLDPLSGSY